MISLKNTRTGKDCTSNALENTSIKNWLIQWNRAEAAGARQTACQSSRRKPWQAALQRDWSLEKEASLHPSYFQRLCDPPPHPSRHPAGDGFSQTRRRRTWNLSPGLFCLPFSGEQRYCMSISILPPFFKKSTLVQKFSLCTWDRRLSSSTLSGMCKPGCKALLKCMRGGFGRERIYLYNCFGNLRKKTHTHKAIFWLVLLSLKNCRLLNFRAFWSRLFSLCFLVEGLGPQLLRSSFYPDCLEEQRHRSWAPFSAGAKPLNFIQGGNCSFSSSLGGHLQESRSVRALITHSIQASDMAWTRRAAVSQDLQRLGVFPDSVILFALVCLWSSFNGIKLTLPIMHYFSIYLSFCSLVHFLLNYLLMLAVNVMKFFAKHVIVSSQLFEIIFMRPVFLITANSEWDSLSLSPFESHSGVSVSSPDAAKKKERERADGE